MKLFIKYFFAFLVVGFFASCEDYLDINDDPNRATSSEVSPLFVGVVNQYATNRVIDLGPALSTGSQLWSGGGSFGAGVFTNPENYTFSIFTTGNTWRAYYREMQKNLGIAINFAQEDGDLWAEAQCKIMRAFTFYSTTVLWGDVPFAQATNVDFSIPEIQTLNPAFDPQQEVLNGVIRELDEAMSLIDQGTSGGITSGDLLYSGDITKWRKFAMSLKFRTLMTIVDADDSVADQIDDIITEGGMIESAGDNAAYPFFDAPGNQNPFWGTLNTFAGGSNLFYFAGERMVDIMKSKNDPRLDAYFQPYPGGGSDPDEVFGAPPGVTNIGFTPWVLSTSSGSGPELVRPSSPDLFFTYAEQALLEAEAIARGLASGGLAEADTKMRAGIRANMERYGVPSEDIDTYLADEIPDLTTLSPEDARRLIAEELWFDCVIRPLEGFTHWRRTEWPELTLPEGAPTQGLLRRLPYPPDELAANSNAPSQLPELDDKMWFDQ